MKKKIYATAGYNTTFLGSGRKEFNPKSPMPGFESYLKEAADGSLSQLGRAEFDAGVISNFMASRFINQANLPGFLPFAVPNLYGKPCTSVEGACGSGGLAIANGVLQILSDRADSVFVTGFEVQNTIKAVYGADILAGAAYYNQERKDGHAFFFPGVFSKRAGAYFKKYGEETTRKAMATWYEQAITNARKFSKAQEFHNRVDDLYSLGMTPPNKNAFLEYLNLYDCSKVSDGASSIVLLSEEGLKKCGVKKEDTIEIIACESAQGDITEKPKELTELTTTKIAVQRALESANISKEQIGLLELHDCFSITAILALEAIGLEKKGKAGEAILEGKYSVDRDLPTNISGGLCGFGHPTGATGVRQLVDLQQQFTRKAEHQAQFKTPFGMMVSMGGDDKTLTAIVTRSTN